MLIVSFNVFSLLFISSFSDVSSLFVFGDFFLVGSFIILLVFLVRKRGTGRYLKVFRDRRGGDSLTSLICL